VLLPLNESVFSVFLKMPSSLLLSRACLLLVSLFVVRGTACLDQTTASTVSKDCQETVCGAPPSSESGGITVFATASDDGPPGKRSVWDSVEFNNTVWPPPGFAYQVSPFYKPAAVLRECSGSVITTFDTLRANLDGRGQTVVSQRNLSASCSSSSCEPIRIISGNDTAGVRILRPDIRFPGGILHIVDR
jgi:hypothetical protein